MREQRGWGKWMYTFLWFSLGLIHLMLASPQNTLLFFTSGVFMTLSLFSALGRI